MKTAPFEWTSYTNTHAELVDSWLDKDAVRKTGIEDGWQSFYDYWTKECPNVAGKSFCYIISKSGVPFGVMFLATIGDTLLISEFIVAPKMRGKGYGAAVIADLVANCESLSDKKISTVHAVIYPSNIPSQKAFEKAGFIHTSTHPDGDAFNYECYV